MEARIYDSELKLMELIWEKGCLCAKEASLLAEERIGWNKNTTYTVLKKLVQKGYISRRDPGFYCEALISREDVQKNETANLLNRLFNGSKQALFSALIEEGPLTEDEIASLKKMIEDRQ